MPYKIRKLPKQDLYRVYNDETKEIHSYGTTLENAKKQVKLLHMIDAGVPLQPLKKVAPKERMTKRLAMPLERVEVSGKGIDNPELYEEAKKIADDTYKKPSAYKSGFIIKKYKELGGTYSGKKEDKGIGIWFKEEWKDIGGKEYPVYRPTKRVTKDTPLTPKEIEPSNLKKQIELKQIIKGEENLPAFIKKKGKGTNCQNIPSFSRIGSKKKLLNEILSYFPDDNWNTYIEPFAGSAQVYKGIEKEPNKKYILNDKNKDIYNIWKNMKSVDSEKMNKYDWKGSKKQFNFLRDEFKPKTKEEQLYKDLYLSRYSYGTMRNNYAYKGSNNYKYLDCSNEIQDIMKNTKILNQDYKKVIKKYDSPTTLFYIDPPYVNKEELYENQSVNPKELKDILTKIKGKFILSYNDVPEVTKEFSEFNIYKIPVRYQWLDNYDKKQTERMVNELIITNYKKFKKQGGSIETDNFINEGIVSLPEFRSVKIDLPTYMYKRMPDIKGEPPPYRYRLVIPITKSRNISSRKKQTSLDINQKPVAYPEVNVKENNEKPKIEDFSPEDRVKIQEYYLKVLENEDKEPNEIEKDPYEIKQRGKPLPCPKQSKNLDKEVKNLGKESSFLENLKEQLKEEPKKHKKSKKTKKPIEFVIEEEEPKEDLFANIKETEKKETEKDRLENELTDLLMSYNKTNYKQYDKRIEEIEKRIEEIKEKEREEGRARIEAIRAKRREELRQKKSKEPEIVARNVDIFGNEIGGKGLLSKNKILSNNNKMANSWVQYVKEYASKNGMSYRDALRCPNCKAGYKKGGAVCKKGMGVIDESEFADQVLLAEKYNDSELGANAGKKYISL